MTQQSASAFDHHSRATRPFPGFTLVEILVALVVAGMLTALLAAILGRGIVASSALGEASEDQRSRVVLHRLLGMDLRGMLPETELTISEQGFTVETVNNHLVPGPLPVTVTWDFSQRQVRRTEEQPDLDYVQELLVISNLHAWSLAFHDLTEGRWVDLRSWLHGTERPAPAGLRLELRPSGAQAAWDLVHRLPLEHDAPI